MRQVRLRALALVALTTAVSTATSLLGGLLVALTTAVSTATSLLGGLLVALTTAVSTATSLLGGLLVALTTAVSTATSLLGGLLPHNVVGTVRPWEPRGWAECVAAAEEESPLPPEEVIEEIGRVMVRQLFAVVNNSRTLTKADVVIVPSERNMRNNRTM
eukprot:gene38997-12907_t